jgi:FKBP-type peptidyl-prolyl cis-trans isomerase
MTKRLCLICITAVLGGLLASCGSSKTPGVQLAPSSGSTAASAPTTPTPPPALAQKPVVAVPKGPPPAKLVIKDLVPGSGQAASTGQSITVNYVGVLYKGGKEFDSSWKTGKPFTTPLSTGSVISGWVQGVAGMKVGGRRELIIPPTLGYGKRGSPPTIPPSSTLVFVIDLLSVG